MLIQYIQYMLIQYTTILQQYTYMLQYAQTTILTELFHILKTALMLLKIIVLSIHIKFYSSKLFIISYIYSTYFLLAYMANVKYGTINHFSLAEVSEKEDLNEDKSKSIAL